MLRGFIFRRAKKGKSPMTRPIEPAAERLRAIVDTIYAIDYWIGWHMDYGPLLLL